MVAEPVALLAEVRARALDERANRLAHRLIAAGMRDMLHEPYRARLFPHLDVRDNVAFPLRSRGVRRTEARTRASEWLTRVGLGDRASAKPQAAVTACSSSTK